MTLIVPTRQQRVIRGIRDRIPGDHVLGRSGSGDGPVEPIPLSRLGAALTSGGFVLSASNLSAALDALLGSAEGTTAQRGPSVWQGLSPGTLNQIYTSGGAAALNRWLSASAWLDAVIGNTQGDIITRGSSSWGVLHRGAAGQVLRINNVTNAVEWYGIVQGFPIGGNLTKWNDPFSLTNGDLSGDVTTSGTLATTLANSGVTAGSYTNSNITVDAKGRVTAASNGGGGSVTGSLLAIQRFSTHQTITPTFNANTNTIFIKLLGAGAGGSSVAAPAASNTAIGVPGGGGAYLERLITGRSNFVGKTLVVGTAGTGGAAAGAPNVGTAGTATTFDAAGANYSAGGGVGGTAPATNVAVPAWVVNNGGLGGTASNGNLNTSGGNGPNWALISGTTPSAISIGGFPANTLWGAPGVANAILTATAQQGADAVGNGAGGSGAICFNGKTPLRGGNGTDGYAEIWEYQ